MNDRDALLQAIIADPADDTLRLVFADYVEERGELERAEFIRVQLEKSKLLYDIPEIHHSSLDMILDPQDMEDQRWKHSILSLQQRERELMSPNGRNARAWSAGPWWDDGWLCNVAPDLTVSIIHPQTGARYDPPPRMSFKFRRGFIAEMTCDRAGWYGLNRRCHECPYQEGWLVYDGKACSRCKGSGYLGFTLGYGPAVVTQHPIEKLHLISSIFASGIDGSKALEWARTQAGELVHG